MVQALCIWRFPEGNIKDAAVSRRKASQPATLMNYFDFHHRMNFPRRRTPRLMKSVSAEPLNRRTYVCAGVVFVIPQEITSHANFLRLVSCRFVARVL